MPTKKQPSKRTAPPWQIILEEIRSQNRATIEAVGASREAAEHRFESLGQRIDRLDHETRTRDAALEMAIRELRLDVRQVQGDMKLLAKLEDRVTAIEKRLAH